MNKVEEGLSVRSIDHLRMGKLNFDIDDASLLKTYGLSTLEPRYVSSGVWRLAVIERCTTGNGKMLIMSWGYRSEGP